MSMVLLRQLEKADLFRNYKNEMETIKMCKYYALYDEQMNGFTFVTGETKKEVADFGADWWWDINLDSELEDINYKYEVEYDDVRKEYGELSFEEYENIILEEKRKEGNSSYVINCGFEIKEISKKEFDILDGIDWHESRINEFDLDKLCKSGGNYFKL